MDNNIINLCEDGNGNQVEVKLSRATKWFLGRDQKKAIKRAAKEAMKNLSDDEKKLLPKFSWKKIVIAGTSVFLIVGAVLVFVCKIFAGSSDTDENTDGTDAPFDEDNEYPSETDDNMDVVNG